MEEYDDKPNERVRGYIFTDYVQDELFLLRLPYTYLCWGEEICPTTGRPHLQGFVYLKDGKTFTAMRKVMETRHIAKAKTLDQAIEYCVGDYTNHKGEYKPKNEVFKEYGKRPKQGQRNDIHKTLEKISTGDYTMRDVVRSATSYQSVRMAEVQLKYFEPPRNWETKVYWFYGPSETGKSRKAFEMCKDPFVCMSTIKWWEGYDGQEDVIIDDYRTDFCTFKEFLRLTDRYPFRVECKGGSRQLRAKRIFITTPKSPEETWMGSTSEELYQLTRRIHQVKKFDKIMSEEALAEKGEVAF